MNIALFRRAGGDPIMADIIQQKVICPGKPLRWKRVKWMDYNHVFVVGVENG